MQEIPRGATLGWQLQGEMGCLTAFQILSGYKSTVASTENVRQQNQTKEGFQGANILQGRGVEDVR